MGSIDVPYLMCIIIKIELPDFTSAKRSIYNNTFTTLLLSNVIHQNAFKIKASLKQQL